MCSLTTWAYHAWEAALPKGVVISQTCCRVIICFSHPTTPHFLLIHRRTKGWLVCPKCIVCCAPPLPKKKPKLIFWHLICQRHGACDIERGVLHWLIFESAEAIDRSKHFSASLPLINKNHRMRLSHVHLGCKEVHDTVVHWLFFCIDFSHRSHYTCTSETQFSDMWCN